AGLAMQTKYPAFLVPGAMLLYAAVRGRWRLGPIAALVAAHVFVAWELLTALLYGESHFLHALRDGEPLEEKLTVLPFLPARLGRVPPAWLLLGLAALRARGRGLALAAGAVLAGYALVALWDVNLAPPLEFPLADGVFALFALALTVVAAWVAWALRRSE